MIYSNFIVIGFFMEKLLNIKQASEILGVHQGTLRRWEDENSLPFPVVKTSKGHRRYKLSDIEQFLNKNPNKNLKTIIYARVSSYKQKEDLDRQEQVLLQYCLQNNIIQPIILKEIGSGMNFERKYFLQIITAIENKEINKLIVNYPDRLARFGFELIQQLCNIHDVELICLNNNPNKSLEEELVSDLISLVVSFSGKLYGHRSHKNKQVIEGIKQLICN